MIQPFKSCAAISATIFLSLTSHLLLAQDRSPVAETLAAVPITWRASAETLKLPGSEEMGLLGGNLLFGVSEKIRLGVGAYGAVTGQRGGFITLGVAGEVRERFAPHWVGHAGLFVGAGGGRGGNTLSGGGLMLRGDLGLTYETASFGSFGVGVSQVRFPSGVISSTQPYVQYEYPFYGLLSPGWKTASGPTARSGSGSGLGSHGSEFSLVARSLKVPASVVRSDGLPQHPSLQLMGVEWLTFLDDRWFLKLESEGAMGGQSNGYMQILAGGGYRMPLTTSTAIKLHAAAGPAGGGGVDTGGGVLIDAGLGLQHRLTDRLALELGLGLVRAPQASFQGQHVAVKLNYLFDLPSVTGSVVDAGALGEFDTAKLRVRLAEQTYFKASPKWRSFSVDQSVSNLGVQLDYFLSPNWYLTGQGLAAFAGDAGAYMTGQVGVGAHWPISERWFVEAEALAGAAGGGGLAVGGGLIAQGNASLGYQITPALAVLGTLGRIQSFNGDFKANVAGVALAYQFTGYVKK